MLIVSDFHDYYDMIQKYGIDKKVVYQRKSSLVKIDRNEIPIIRNLGGSWWSKGSVINPNLPLDYRYGVVGFCGKIFPFVRVYGKEDPVTREKPHTCYYSLEDLEGFIGKSKKLKKEYETSSQRWYAKGTSGQDRTRQFFSHYGSISDDHLFRMWNVPIFIYAIDKDINDVVVTNPILKTLQFFKVETPYDAYQKIHQYISGVLGVEEAEMVEISDEDMMAKKGFFEWSFKTLSGTKKPRRRGK